METKGDGGRPARGASDSPAYNGRRNEREEMIKNIGELVEGMKVVLSISGVAITDARVMIGTGTAGKPRVWFCQNTAVGGDNSNPYGYRFAFSVGVERDGSLRLAVNGVSGLRAWTAADDAPKVILTLSDGSKVAEQDYVTPRGVFAAPAGYRLERLSVVGAKTVERVNGKDYPVDFADGVASAGMEFKTVSKFAAAIAERRQAIAKYEAIGAAYNRLAAKYGWARV